MLFFYLCFVFCLFLNENDITAFGRLWSMAGFSPEKCTYLGKTHCETACIII